MCCLKIDDANQFVFRSFFSLLLLLFVFFSILLRSARAPSIYDLFHWNSFIEIISYPVAVISLPLSMRKRWDIFRTHFTRTNQICAALRSVCASVFSDDFVFGFLKFSSELGGTLCMGKDSFDSYRIDRSKHQTINLRALRKQRDPFRSLGWTEKHPILFSILK